MAYVRCAEQTHRQVVGESQRPGHAGLAQHAEEQQVRLMLGHRRDVEVLVQRVMHQAGGVRQRPEHLAFLHLALLQAPDAMQLLPPVGNTKDGHPVERHLRRTAVPGVGTGATEVVAHFAVFQIDLRRAGIDDQQTVVDQQPLAIEEAPGQPGLMP